MEVKKTVVKITCELSGKNFSPKKLKEDINDIEYDNYVIEDEPFGSKNGFCSVMIPDRFYLEGDPIGWLADFVVKNKKIFDKNGVEDISIDIFWRNGEIFFTKEEMKSLARMKLDVSLSYYIY